MPSWMVTIGATGRALVSYDRRDGKAVSRTYAEGTAAD